MFIIIVCVADWYYYCLIKVDFEVLPTEIGWKVLKLIFLDIIVWNLNVRVWKNKKIQGVRTILLFPAMTFDLVIVKT